MKRFILSTAFTLLAGAAIAGPQYVDETGFAASGYDVVAYFDLDQSAVGSAQPKGVAGKSAITSEYNGATFAFSSKANKKKFDANPAKYAPQFDGHCAYGVSKGGKVPGNPNLWRIVDDKLYLNITKNVVGFWEENIPGNITLADNNWVGIENNKASKSTIPNFSSSAPSK
ncbi:YHS domain-containing (seleno)protein [Shimia abyssi]|uniref:YHS domain-containing protein n=1 Tax=Shimia abyssi TaxID=1662395 RepID=A0A2P8FBM8_9RHOB|nr:YHS domain-containing (seleno)protein [Shimia abyssi]PSL19062.1 YHS domain-containing protein [Shimia abyssi]